MSHAVQPVFLIASGAYVESELEAEFGRLPPAFLPLGNRRLYVHQHAAIADRAARVLLSLPESFVPDPTDVEHLARLGIELVFVPEHLSLGESVVYVINVSAIAGAPLFLLHGDTLLTGLDMTVADAVSIESAPPSDYQWGGVRVQGDAVEVLAASPEAEAPNAVLTGYFSFSDSSRLVQDITRQAGAFLGGLRAYGQHHPLKPLTARDWFDFGHAGTYHRSRRRVTTEREFNRLATTLRSVTKSGTKPTKIEAEARWFEQLPAPLRLYTPAYLGRRGEGDAVAYALEYLHLPTLADLFVFGRLRRDAWEKVFAACDEVLSAMAAHRPDPLAPAAAGPDLYLEKTLERLEAYARATGLDLDAPCRFGGAWLPSLQQMARLAASAIPPFQPEQATLIHGDFCFSNVLYDVRAHIVRMIDPRGLDSAGGFSTSGDLRYDIAKLHHSAVGLYDHIIAGNYRLDLHGPLDFSLALPDDPATRAVGETFLAQTFAGRRPADSASPAIAVLLFLSMLPLHADDARRQQALLANGLRLFQLMDTRKG